MTTAAETPTVNLAEPVYGATVAVDDPAELLHEVSKVRPALVRREMRGVWALEANPALQVSVSRAVRRNPALPRLRLPAGDLPPVALADVLRRRRSARTFAAEPLELEDVSALLRAAYGVTADAPFPGMAPLRAAPSGGALYPLELFVVAQRVEELDAGLYHYDPLAHELEVVDGRVDLGGVSPHSTLVDDAAAVFFVGAVFWRSRFKYGLRAYRFTLLEAGHAMQNALLAATALEIGGIVLGGFYDDDVDALLGLDGVNESVLIAACFGRTGR